MEHPITEQSKDIRALELEFAYLQASGALEGFCLHPDGEEDQWTDLENAIGSDGEPIDLSDEVAYLDSRRLLMRHPEHPNWVQILDEGEPLAETTSATGVPDGVPGLRIREVVTSDGGAVEYKAVGAADHIQAERVERALKAFDRETSRVADFAEEFLDNYQAELEAGIYEDLEGEEQKDALQAVKDFRTTIADRRSTSEELFRAVTGAPAAESEVQA